MNLITKKRRDNKKKTRNTNFGSADKSKPTPADHVVSKGKTPIEAGGRPCRHCNSGKHWDYDCPHSDYHKNRNSGKFQRKPFQKKFKKFKKKFQKAQTKFIELDDKAWEVFACFEETNLYSDTTEPPTSSLESSSESSDSDGSSDF